MKIGVVTTTDTRTAKTDESGRIVAELAQARFPAAALVSAIVPDERAAIEALLIRLVDEDGCALVLTSGGTGVAPRDVTPEATMAVCDRPVPGLGEAMRQASLAITPMAMLSRAVAGTRGRALIVNLPGSPKGARECFEVVAPVLGHALELLAGGKPH